MIPVCIFTYSGDALLIADCVNSVLAADCFPVVCDDAAHPLPRNVVAQLESMGAEYLKTSFKRRGNLNGTDCAAGICRTLEAASRRYGTASAMKLDSDCLLVDPTPFLVGNNCIRSSLETGRFAYGAAYSLTTETAASVATELEFSQLDESAPEDLTIWETVTILDHEHTPHEFAFDAGPFAAVPLNASPFGSGRYAVLTFGNTPEGGWKDRALQISRQMKAFSKFLSLT